MDDGIDFGALEEGKECNYWSVDRTIQRICRRAYPADAFDWAESRLEEFGHLVGHTVAENADYIDDHGPELQTYDRRGNIVNEVRYPAEQLENEEHVYEAGIVSDVFHAPPGREEPLPFTHNLAMQYLLCYADPGFDCPVAMTTGAALVLERFDDGTLEEYYEGLTSRDYEDLIEGAMFLTEEQGGSDVGANETIAEPTDEEGVYELTGEKWFCSNIDAQGTLALGRTPDAPDGTEGLSMFLVPHRTPDGELNDQRYRRLKDKLGTIAVPTGEVEFQGATGYLVGSEEAGFKQMAEMLNLERLSNAVASCGIVGRALLESRVYAQRREAFGNPIAEYPLMREDLVDMTVEHEAATAYTFEAARFFSERERAVRAGEDAEETYRLMRLLIPIAKARTARVAVDTASYAMEIQGGNGYVNDFVTHRLLRDAQVLPIWEGTENILSLDVLRALEREEAHEPLVEVVQSRIEAADGHPPLDRAREVTADAFTDLSRALATLASADGDYAQLSAKRLGTFIYDVFTAALLLEQAAKDLEDGSGRTALVAHRFVDLHLADRDARGIPSGDRFPLEYFESVVNFSSIDPETLAESPPTPAD